MQPTTRTLSPEEIPAFVRDRLLDPERPVVAVTTNYSTGRYLVDVGQLEERLGAHAEVVAIETGDATLALADALPDRLDVYGGALRVWWPGPPVESDPYDHRLYVVRSEGEAWRAVDRIERELRRRAGEPGGGNGRVAGTAALPDVEPVAVTLTAVRPAMLAREESGRWGRIVRAGVPLDALALCLEEGTELRARPIEQGGRGAGSTRYSLEGMLPTPWERVDEELSEGDVVRGRVVAILPRYALIELLPGAKGIVGIAEVDHTFVEDIESFIRVNEVVTVKILQLDPQDQRAQLSIKAVHVTREAPRPSPSLVPGGPPFDWGAYVGVERPPEPEEEDGDEAAERARALADELEAVTSDRADLRR